jgi:hypothetical protein
VAFLLLSGQSPSPIGHLLLWFQDFPILRHGIDIDAKAAIRSRSDVASFSPVKEYFDRSQIDGMKASARLSS